jgi:hypothetical protein
MKKKIFTRPVSVVLTEEMFSQIQKLTDRENIGFSDYIREAIQEKLTNEKSINSNKRNGSNSGKGEI